MKWMVGLIISLVVFALSIGLAYMWAKKKHKNVRIITSFNIFATGVALASVFMFLPIYSEQFDGNWSEYLEIIFLSIHNTFRLFIVDGEFDIVQEQVFNLQGWVAVLYPLWASFLFFFAPILTFGVVLSIFKNVFSYMKFGAKYFSDVYIFSELNEKTLTLAKSLKESNKKNLIVFTDVFDKDEESFFELREQAKEIDAALFRRDIASINFSKHSAKKKIVFFTMGENEAENLKQTLTIIKKYRDRENTFVYVFATNIESELLLCDIDKGEIVVHRINEVRSLVNRLLFEDGIKIFRNAAEYDEKEKLISAVVIGMGAHGTEMAKALPWFCQMDGYRVEINLFDIDKYAESKFSCMCPELMDNKYNGDFATDGEAHYKITVHSKMDIERKEFWDELKTIGKVTYVFVALGSDEKNIRAAVNLRAWFEKTGLKPQIDAIVFDVDKKNALTSVKNRSGQEYGINFIGNIEESYSEKVILKLDVEQIALERHLRWGKEEDFWKYEYNYRSSIASAIHRKMKIECGIPGADMEPDKREEAARWALRKLEHQRWNAYMRSEGYTFAEKRNDLAMNHPCLVPFEQLSEKDKAKDDD